MHLIATGPNLREAQVLLLNQLIGYDRVTSLEPYIEVKV